MFAVAATLRKQAFCDYYVSANQAIFFHTRSGGKMAKFQCQLMRQTLSCTRSGGGNREVSVSANEANTFPVHVAEGKMAKFQCQLIRQLLSCTLNSQNNSKDLVYAIKQTPGLAGRGSGPGRLGRLWGPEVTGSLLDAVRGRDRPESLGTPK